MPRRKSRGGDSDDEASPRVFGNMSSLLEAFARAQAESNRQLVESILSAQATGARTLESPVAVPSPAGNFTRCTARFDGSSHEPEVVEAFLDAVNVYKECAHVNDDHALRGLPMLLEGQAAVWYRGVKASITSWNDAIQRLRAMFGAACPPYKVFLNIYAARHMSGERAEVFVNRLRAMMAKLPYPISDVMSVDMIYGLLDKKIRKRVTRDAVATLDELIEKARNIEDSLVEVTAVPSPPLPSELPPSRDSASVRVRAPAVRATCTPSVSPHACAPAAPPTPASVPPAPQSAPRRVATAVSPSTTTEQGKVFRNNYKRRNSGQKTQNSSAVSCYGCGANGVIRPNCESCKSKDSSFFACDIVNNGLCSDCFKKSNASSICNCTHSNSSPIINDCSNVVTLRSYDCRHCNSDKVSKNKVVSTNTKLSKSNNVLPKSNKLSKNNNLHTSSDLRKICVLQKNSKLTKNVKLHNGSELSQCSEILNSKQLSSNGFIYNCGSIELSSLRTDRVYNNDCCKNVSPTSLCTSNDYAESGRPILDIEICGHKGTGLVDTAAKRCVAGYSLYRLLCKLNHPFDDSVITVKLADGVVRDIKAKIAEVDVRLRHKVIPVSFVIFPDSNNNETLLGIDFLRKAGLVFNFSDNTWFSADRPRVIHPLRCETSRNSVGCASTEILRSDEGTMLSPSERTQLAGLLQEYDDIFKPGGGPTPFAEHRIETGAHAPIAVPPYRLTPAKKAVMEAELAKMLQDGIIEECESPWAAPALLVPKKDGTYRFCVDYRKLNAVTESDSYPLPVIDDLLQYTGKSCFMSTIDLKAGYWQVSVRAEDQDKTAFVTPFGVYRFKRMPFGLRNAPATFQRLIDRFRSGAALQDVTILGYIDDLIIISDSYSRHLQDLRAVFDRLRDFHLYANRDKCVFVRNKVKYLGHVITPKGIAPDPDKISCIVAMKEPTTVKHLLSFIQSCSWFRKFVPNFSQVAQPLTMLTKKNQPWMWGEAQANAFNELKRLLTSSPILVQPDYTRPFILRTDASGYALGAALLQGETPQDERPIAYASRLLIAAERNYSTTEREALAVVWAVEKFRGYIDGHRVLVRSDHQPLKWLLTLKSPSGRLVRWAMKLQSFDLQVDYVPGKANVVADLLSRPPCDEEARDSCSVCTVVIETPRWEVAALRDDQLADLEVSKIIKAIEGQDDLERNRWTERGYHMSRGVLYRYTEAETEEPQLVIPENRRKQVMVECHDSATAGHGGVDRTYHRVAQRFYFPGMRRYIAEYLKTCIECQRYKPSNEKPAGLLQTPVPAQRFEVVAVDLFGPLPTGPKGERWVLIVEDTASKWVELFPLVEATAEVCAKVLIEEVFLRFGVPRRLISDNGVQFVADVMQHAMFTLGVQQNLIPLYHPEANPVERKNRDLKTQLAILVEGHHHQWPEVLPFIRFAMNTSTTKSTQQTPAYLTFARQLRSPIEAQSDLRAVIEAENYVPQVTPYLLKLADTLTASKECIEKQQDIRKAAKDITRRSDNLVDGDLVLMKTHVLSNAAKGRSSKLVPKRDGPYIVHKVVSPTTYLLSFPDRPDEVVGKYHISDLKRYHARDGECFEVPKPVVPKRRRGRPRKNQT